MSTVNELTEIESFERFIEPLKNFLGKQHTK